jgi:hypothetical protein
VYLGCGRERVKRHFISNVSMNNMLPTSYRMGGPDVVFIIKVILSDHKVLFMNQLCKYVSCSNIGKDQAKAVA